MILFRMQLEPILQTLKENQQELRQRGIDSLVLIDPSATLSSGQPLHFLIDFAPPHTYQRLRNLTLHLSGLLAYPVELVLVSASHSAVQPYLDPDAVVIL
jgi:predicted nucleotidyltransferase